jgi:hypothetical protein
MDNGEAASGCATLLTLATVGVFAKEYMDLETD